METSIDPLQTLRKATVANRVVEGFRPFTESVEWRLSELYWMTQGTRGFMEDQIPYLVTSGGVLAQDAAELLFASCLDARTEGELVVLELCAGSGLFARQFVDSFRRKCAAAGLDYHQRLTYYATDRSRETVAQWKKMGVFANSGVTPAWCDARRPAEVETADGPVTLEKIRTAICNYGLDSLPAAVVRKGEQGPEELCVRTHLTMDDARIREYGSPTAAKIRELLEAGDTEVLNCAKLLELEAAFRPCEREYPMLQEALALYPDEPRLILNYGAMECLRQLDGMLEPGGFVFFSDYGVLAQGEPSWHSNPQRFGPSMAVGLHFPLIGEAVRAMGADLLVPESDSLSKLHTRVMLRGAAQETRTTFAELFATERVAARKKRRGEAATQSAAGAVEEAKRLYEEALEECPTDWALLGEVAEFLLRQVVDFEAGLTLAKAAVTLNPWYSTWLWNVYGDAYYGLKRFPEALASYRVAEEMSPTDVRTQVNISYAYAALGNFEKSLVAIGKGLAYDTSEEYRERLLEKQRLVLEAAKKRSAGDEAARERRKQRLASC